MSKTIIACASVVTQKCVQEFELLAYSIQQHHDVEWFLSTDEGAATALGSKYNCNILIDHDEGSHGVPDSESNKQHMKMMMTKFDACEAALEKSDSVLFMDADIFFLNPIEDSVLSLMQNPAVDALLCPHHTENKKNEANVGYYNAGFFIMRNKQLLHEWKEMSKKYKELGMFYEQQPLEYASKTYTTVSLPMHYDVGWWRMCEDHTKERLQQFELKDDIIHFMGNPVVSIHAHTFKRLDHGNWGAEMLSVLCPILKKSNHRNHHEFCNKLVEICREWE